MWLPFVLENLHFAIHLFVALVLFATFWLYFDAWKGKKTLTAGIRLLGFIALALSFIVSAITIESSILQVPFVDSTIAFWGELVLRSLGYSAVLVGVFCERVQSAPRGMRERVRLTPAMAGVMTSVISIPNLVLIQSIPVMLACIVSVFYFCRAIVGLESHVRPIAVAFALFSLAQFVGLADVFRTSPIIPIFSLVRPFGPLWILELGLFFCAACVLGRWVFGYLLKQFEAQLFMILSVITLVIFLVTAVTFTGLLLKNVQDETLVQLAHDAKVLQYALDTKRTESIADAQMIAQSPLLVANIQLASRSGVLSSIAQTYLLSKRHSFLVLTDRGGKILARGEDGDQTGQSISADTLFQRAIDGNTSSTILSEDGVTAPIVTLRAAAPIIVDKKTIGSVLLGTQIDNAFVDGIKTATGLEASVYGGDRIGATTLTESDTKTRLLGLTEMNQEIKSTVLLSGKSFSGGMTIGSTPFFAAYLPLLDVDTNPAGMIFVGRPQLSVLQAASRSIELTFISTALLVLLSIVPSYLIARSIANQLE